MTSGAREEDVKFFRSQKSDRETDRDGMSDKDDRSKRASKRGGEISGGGLLRSAAERQERLTGSQSTIRRSVA